MDSVAFFAEFDNSVRDSGLSLLSVLHRAALNVSTYKKIRRHAEKRGNYCIPRSVAISLLFGLSLPLSDTERMLALVGYGFSKDCPLDCVYLNYFTAIEYGFANLPLSNAVSLKFASLASVASPFSLAITHPSAEGVASVIEGMAHSLLQYGCAASSVCTDVHGATDTLGDIKR